MTGLLALGVALFWLSGLLDASIDYPTYVAPFIVAGIGMGLVFAPSATAVLATMAPVDHAKASGTNSMLREVGVALGIAVSTAVFTGRGRRAEPGRLRRGRRARRARGRRGPGRLGAGRAAAAGGEGREGGARGAGSRDAAVQQPTRWMHPCRSG